MIYLDHNATTPVDPAVVEAMLPYLTEHWGNPSSDHPWGRAAGEGVQRARVQVAALVAARPEQVVFTSGGTEANNLAIRGIAAAQPGRRHLVISAVEHPATSAPAAHLERQGWRVTRLGVGPGGHIDPAHLPSNPTLISVMLANNETGVVQPIAPLAAAAKQRGAWVHTDAAQAVGKIAVDFDALQVDALSIAGHKLYAPKGVGALVLREGTPLQPLVLGASHEGGLRPGTENVASIVGLGTACELARRRLVSEGSRLAGLRDALAERLRHAVPGLVRVAPESDTLPNTLCVLFPGVTGSGVLAATPEVAASTGSACHAGAVTASAVLLAMGIPAEAAKGSVRLSLGHGTSSEDVDEAAAALTRAHQRVSSLGI